jgi:hypothetical protein
MGEELIMTTFIDNINDLVVGLGLIAVVLLIVMV